VDHLGVRDAELVQYVFEHVRGSGGGQCEDRRLARSVRACRDLPGQHLFQYAVTTASRLSYIHPRVIDS
jgi:DNA topoisomerase IB